MRTAEIVILGVVLSIIWVPLLPAQFEALVASDAGPAAHLGRSLVYVGDRLVVGAPDDDDLGATTGAVYVFRNGATGWVEEQKLLAATPAPGSAFGFSVAMSADGVLAIGAPFDDTLAPNAGAVFVFRWAGSRWVEEAKITAGTRGDKFGWSVGLSDGFLVVGVPFYDDSPAEEDSGRANVYRYDGGSWTLLQVLKAYPSRAYAQYGWSVTVDSQWLAVSKVNDQRGLVDLYEFDGSLWRRQQSLTPPGDYDVDDFGYSVACSGDVLLVGAPEDDLDDTGPGMAFLYRRRGSSAELEAVITGKGDAGLDSFGRAVAVTVDAALVAGSGKAFLFCYDGTMWQYHNMFAGHPEDEFGYAVATNGASVAMGAPSSDVAAQDAGVVYVGDFDGTGCSPTLYGEGTPGSAGFVPVITSVTCPFLGSARYTVRATNALGGAVGALLIGFDRASDSSRGWTLLVDMVGPPRGVVIPVLYGGTGPGGGTADVTLAIPFNPYLNGLVLAMQFVVLDQGASHGVAATEGLEAVLYEAF
ncbi:MAG: FG-GAP repeat protein [Planctomycetota bacterium]